MPTNTPNIKMPKEVNIKGKNIPEPKVPKAKVNLKGSWVDADDEKKEKEHLLPNVFFGAESEIGDMEDLGEEYARDDDEVQKTTDPDIVDELGFDPLEFENETPEGDK